MSILRRFSRGLVPSALFVFTAAIAITVIAPPLPAQTAAASPPPRPTLVVVISVDQMRADYLARFRPWFGKDGFNRFLERGAVWPEARHRYSSLFTAPGHASIGTGLDPRDSGIILNRWYDAIRGDPVYCTEDRRTAWVGAGAAAPKIPVQPASPLFLDGDSLGDRLKEKFPGARVVGVALKDRASVLMAGKKADAAIWFEEKFARFVTSTYYPPHPSLLAYDAKLPAFFADPRHRTWVLSGKIPPADLDRITFDPPELAGSKDQPEGYGAMFPHTMTTPFQIVHSPWGDDLVLGIALSVIADMRLGSSIDHPDLLFVGLSSTDYYGHWFGPDSREIADGIVRLDQKLEEFFHALDRKVGRDRVLVFLSADHGVQPIPEVAIAREKARTGSADPGMAGRVDFSNGRNTGEHPAVGQLSAARQELERLLAKKYGYDVDAAIPAIQEADVVFFDEPCLYLNRPVLARRHLDPEAVKADVAEWARSRPGVEAVYTNTQIQNGLPASTPHGLEIERSFRSDRSGDLIVILKPGWMWSYGRDRGTTHGQPNDDDARVPLAAWGPGVRAGSYGGRVSPISIAKTVGALFGFAAGEPDADVLVPVLGHDSGVKRTMDGSKS